MRAITERRAKTDFAVRTANSQKGIAPLFDTLILLQLLRPGWFGACVGKRTHRPNPSTGRTNPTEGVVSMAEPDSFFGFGRRSDERPLSVTNTGCLGLAVRPWVVFC